MSAQVEKSLCRRAISKVLPLKTKQMLGAFLAMSAKLSLRFNRHVFFSNALRMSIYRLLGIKAAEHAIIWCGARINHPNNISIGRNSIIGPNMVLLSQGGIEIGGNVNISGFGFI